MWSLLLFQQGSCKQTRKGIGLNELKKAKPLFTEYSIIEALLVLRVQKKKDSTHSVMCYENQTKLSL